jgi:hypothetical protein
VTNLLEVGAARWRRPFACKLHDADFKGEFKLGDGGVLLWLERLASCLSCLDGSCKPAGLGSPVVVTPHNCCGGVLVSRIEAPMSPAKRIYEPRIFEGRVMLPEEQEQIFEEIIQFERMEYVSPQMRELILDVWPELAHKLPPENAAPPDER